ncbi:beta-galactosidase [uncultured Vagococcus sp.]|uniref:glycoside hydrolase family 35 protein n=1 Tax=uncultured Vagococcus sp. TaxID=189676 RepID=UPI0028D1C482|nr:beta-galactosidase [uncultured Vagococcus sp.]
MSQIFEIKDDFYLDNQPFKVISGAIHYFRVVPEYWEHRLKMLRNMGCNTVETYVPWNFHEPREGEFDFSEGLNIRQYIQLAHDLGLKVILRPSPYICAEWEFGGQPSWLLNDPEMRVRSNYQPYLAKVKNYYERFFMEVKDLQITAGGPIIMIQVENEFGGYSNDKDYLRSMVELLKINGVNVPLVTSDGPWHDMLANGSLPDMALPTINCGSEVSAHFKKLREFHGKPAPLMVMEFWIGWFDAWQDPAHHTTDVVACANELEAILSEGHVNIYMFHGGTNFGFSNGANYYGKLLPDTTSYDYDAPLNEYGEPTDKYVAFQKVIQGYRQFEIEEIPPISRLSPRRLSLTAQTGLTSNLIHIASEYTGTYPLNMEAMDQPFGYVYYVSDIGGKRKIEDFRLIETADRASVYVNDEPILTKYDTDMAESVAFDLTSDSNQLQILVENMGRVNYSVTMNSQRKGIVGGVIINGAFQTGWRSYSLDFGRLTELDYELKVIGNTPTFNKFECQLDEVGDTFIDMSQWGKGVVFVNGFNLGRYWQAGPQTKLYIPGPKLKLGLNEIVIFETEGKEQNQVILTDIPDVTNGLRN